MSLHILYTLSSGHNLSLRPTLAVYIYTFSVGFTECIVERGEEAHQWFRSKVAPSRQEIMEW